MDRSGKTLLKNSFFDFTIDPNLTDKTNDTHILSSTNDDREILDSVDILMQKLKNVKLHEFKDYGHFCFDDMKTKEFPE